MPLNYSRPKECARQNGDNHSKRPHSFYRYILAGKTSCRINVSRKLVGLAFARVVDNSFGIGVAVPLVTLGLMSREVMMKWRERMLSASCTLKMAMGGILALPGL